MRGLPRALSIPLTITIGWTGYLCYKYWVLDKVMTGWEGLVLFGLLTIIVVICEIHPSARD